MTQFNAEIMSGEEGNDSRFNADMRSAEGGNDSRFNADLRSAKERNDSRFNADNRYRYVGIYRNQIFYAGSGTHQKLLVLLVRIEELFEIFLQIPS